MDVRVIGGGVLGAAAALELAERGHDVVLQERQRLGGGATGRAAGILSTMTWNDDDMALVAQTRGRIGELISLAMIEGDISARATWKPLDSIAVASGEGLAWMDDVQARLERGTEEPERLDHRTAAREYPALAFAPGEEVLVAQEDGVVEAGDLMQVLRGRLEAEGVDVQEDEDGRLDSDAEATVVAAGAWTQALVEEATGMRLHLGNFRTQLASVQAKGGDQVPILHDRVHGFYARPDGEESLLAGDGTVLERHDPEHQSAADGGFRTTLSERLVQRLASPENAEWRTGWSGLCVGTPDRRPLCGKVPGTDGLFVLTGDNGFGLMRCFGLGERLADAVDGRGDPLLDPGRFEGVDPDGFPLREGYG